VSRVLVTGATGYVGGRLVPRLLEDGHEVRCLVRTPEKLTDVPWRDDVEIVRGSIDGPLDVAMAGIDTAVYLIHGIGQSHDWVAKESRDAEHFRLAAEAAGVRRIIYLGGMGADDAALSIHLASRHAVGRTLAAGPIPVTELRAAVIIGSGSASFEMLRYLVEVLPIMVAPKWVATRSQPVAISDVLDYLVKVIDSPEPIVGILEMGGPDIVSYSQMMTMYAEEAGLKRRRVFVVPFLTPHLSSRWVGLVTPVPGSLARPLVDSLVNEVVVRDHRTIDLLGPPKRTLREAIRLALGVISRNEVPTSFTSADLQPFRKYSTDPAWSGGTELRDVRVRHSDASVEDVFAAITSLGGEKGWHRGEWLWRLRGFSDLLWGGPGLRRGRRHPHELHEGDFVDFWRVEAIEVAPHVVRLHAEMVLPGDAWLQWTVAAEDHVTTVTQEALFRPRGLLGRAYWYAIAPFHVLVFPGLLKGIVHDAETR
jgi:uncharacterized protein YbjT (DUF2867 family)